MTTDTISSLAKQAASQLGWSPAFVQNQMTLETDHFTSNVWKVDNNPAGIKWYPGMTYGTKGTPAPDGGFYAHFTDPVAGYVNFVKSNPRYSNVGNSQDALTEAQTIQKDGWATDPNYANKVMHTNANGNQTVNFSPGTGFSLTDIPGLISKALGTIVGAGLIFLGIWIAMNPFADLTSAITSTLKQFGKMPLEGATNAVKKAPGMVRNQNEKKQMKKNDEIKKRKEDKALDKEMMLLEKHIAKLNSKKMG